MARGHPAQGSGRRLQGEGGLAVQVVAGRAQQGADVHRVAAGQVQGEVQQAQVLRGREPLALLAGNLGDQIGEDGPGVPRPDTSSWGCKAKPPKFPNGVELFVIN